LRGWKCGTETFFSLRIKKFFFKSLLTDNPKIFRKTFK
jgi:hypothetical protein